MAGLGYPYINAEELKAYFDLQMTKWINDNYPMEANRDTLLFQTEAGVAPNVSFTTGLNWRAFFESGIITTVPNAADGDASFQASQIRSGGIITGSTILDLFVGHASLECTRFRKISVTRKLTGSTPFQAVTSETRSARAGRLLSSYRAPGFQNPWYGVYLGNGQTITYDRISSYIIFLRTEWRRVAIDSTFALEGTVCHASCHNSCHNSRGRR